MKHNKKTVNLCSAVCPLGPSKKVRAAIRKAVKNVRLFPDNETAVLKRLFLSKYGLHSDEILFANSLQELIFLIPAVLRPKRVVIVGPALTVYEEASLAAGAEVLTITGSVHTGFEPDRAELKEAVKDAGLIFIASPNRVTGKLAGIKDLCDTVNEMAAGGTRIVLDESLTEFTGNEGIDVRYSPMGSLVILRTTAYFYGLPGLELACAVSAPDIISAFENSRHWSINHLALEAARAALRDSVYKKLVKDHTINEKHYLFSALGRIKGLECYDSDSNVFLIKVDNHAEGLLKILARSGLEVQSCRDIKGLDGTFLRFSVAKHDYNKKFVKILYNSLHRIVSD